MEPAAAMEANSAAKEATPEQAEAHRRGFRAGRRVVLARLGHVSDVLALLVLLLALSTILLGTYARGKATQVTKLQQTTVEQQRDLDKTNGALAELRQQAGTDRTVQLSLQRQIDQLRAEIGTRTP